MSIPCWECCDFSCGRRVAKVLRAASLAIYLIISCAAIGCDQGPASLESEALETVHDATASVVKETARESISADSRGNASDEPPAIDLDGADKAVSRAIVAASARVRDTPDSAEAWGKLGMTLLAHEFKLPAAHCFERAAALDEQEPRWPYLHARSILLTNPREAVPLLEAAAKLAGKRNLTPRLTLAELLLELGQTDDAERQLRFVLEQEPDTARALIAVARIHFSHGDYLECLSSCRKAEAAGGPRKETALLMAAAERHAGHNERADALLSAAEKLGNPAWRDPFFADAMQLQTGLKPQLVRADRLFGKQKIDESIALLSKTVNEYPDSVWAKLLLGRALIRARRLPEADAVLKEALQLAPDSVEAYFRLGVILNLQKRFRDAAAQFQRAVELKPDFTMAHYNLGYARRELGDLPGAIAAYRHALSCQPDLYVAHAALGDLLARTGQLQEARAQLEIAAKLQPNDAWARGRLQQVMRQLKASGGGD